MLRCSARTGAWLWLSLVVVVLDRRPSSWSRASSISTSVSRCCRRFSTSRCCTTRARLQPARERARLAALVLHRPGRCSERAAGGLDLAHAARREAPAARLALILAARSATSSTASCTATSWTSSTPTGATPTSGVQIATARSRSGGAADPRRIPGEAMKILLANRAVSARAWTAPSTSWSVPSSCSARRSTCATRSCTTGSWWTPAQPRRRLRRGARRGATATVISVATASRRPCSSRHACAAFACSTPRAAGDQGAHGGHALRREGRDVILIGHEDIPRSRHDGQFDEAQGGRISLVEDVADVESSRSAMRRASAWSRRPRSRWTTRPRCWRPCSGASRLAHAAQGRHLLRHAEPPDA